MVKKKEISVRLSKDECLDKELHFTKYIYSAFGGKYCKFCMEHRNEQ